MIHGFFHPPFKILSLSSVNLIIMCLVVALFEFFLFVGCWASWVCRCFSLNLKFFGHYIFKYSFCLILLFFFFFWESHIPIMPILVCFLLSQSLRDSVNFSSFFFLFLRLDSFNWSILKFADFFPSACSNFC